MSLIEVPPAQRATVIRAYLFGLPPDPSLDEIGAVFRIAAVPRPEPQVRRR